MSPSEIGAAGFFLRIFSDCAAVLMLCAAQALKTAGNQCGNCARISPFYSDLIGFLWQTIYVDF